MSIGSQKLQIPPKLKDTIVSGRCVAFIGLFGSWFTCGKFPKPWLLDRLHQFVEVSPTPEPDHEIADRLAEMVEMNVEKSVQILDKILRGDREGWRIHRWENGAKRVLEQALKATEAARETAEQLIDYLGRRRYIKYGSLLTLPPPRR